jgi:hypothetical protein
MQFSHHVHLDFPRQVGHPQVKTHPQALSEARGHLNGTDQSIAAGIPPGHQNRRPGNIQTDDLGNFKGCGSLAEDSNTV